MSLKIQIPTSDIKAAFTTAVASALSAEKALGADAQAQLTQLVEELYPLVEAETQSLMTNPNVAQGYLAVLAGTVEATIARLALSAIAVQSAQIAAAFSTGIQILGLVLKAAVAV